MLQQLGDAESAAAERRAAAQISQTNTSLQAARFNTNSGIRMLTAGDLEGALAQFQSAIHVSPQYAPAHFQLAVALQRKGDLAGARAEYKKASHLDPQLQSPLR